MEIKFLISVPNGDFGRGGQQVNASNIIEIEEQKNAANIDISDIGEINTGSVYRDQPIYRNLIVVGSTFLLNGSYPSGYNSGLRLRGFRIDSYIKTTVRKINPVAGDPLAGGFHSLSDVFGSKKILYNSDGIFFEGSDVDGIIEPIGAYEFLLEYTKSGRRIPIDGDRFEP